MLQEEHTPFLQELIGWCTNSFSVTLERLMSWKGITHQALAEMSYKYIFHLIPHAGPGVSSKERFRNVNKIYIFSKSTLLDAFIS